MGTGNDEHRDEPLDRVGRLGAGGQPGNQRYGPRDQRHDGEPEGGAIRERLRARA